MNIIEIIIRSKYIIYNIKKWGVFSIFSLHISINVITKYWNRQNEWRGFSEKWIDLIKSDSLCLQIVTLILVCISIWEVIFLRLDSTRNVSLRMATTYCQIKNCLIEWIKCIDRLFFTSYLYCVRREKSKDGSDE